VVNLACDRSGQRNHLLLPGVQVMGHSASVWSVHLSARPMPQVCAGPTCTMVGLTSMA
jgi:hypothetical protein